MPENVQFHFLLLAAGEVLKRNPTVSSQDIQDFIQDDEAFRVRPPLENCRLALRLLALSGFLKILADDIYIKA